MAKFSYWDSGETIEVDLENGEELSPDEAQVVATLHVARALDDISSQIKNFLYFLQNHAVDVAIRDSQSK